MKVKFLKESDNTTMKKDVVGTVPVVYADAVNQAGEKKKIIADRLKGKQPTDKPFTGTTKQPVPKKVEQAKSELSEALFEDYSGDDMFDDMKHFGDTKGIKQTADCLGIPGARMISHGEWADAEIEFDGKLYSYPDVEDYLLADYREENPEDKNDDGFDAWLDEHGKEYTYVFDEIEPKEDVDESIKEGTESTSGPSAGYLSHIAERVADFIEELLEKINISDYKDQLDAEREQIINKAADELHDLAYELAHIGGLDKDESLKEDWRDEVTEEDLMHVYDKCNKLISVMRTHNLDFITPDTNTYGLSGNFISLASKGFVDLDNLRKYTKDLNTEEDDDFDESLTESPTATLKRPKTKKVKSVKMPEIEGQDDDVYTLVYDRLFPGNRKYRPFLAKGLKDMYDEDKFYTKGLGDTDIGVAVADEEDAELAKAVANELKLEYELKKSILLKDDDKYIAVIRIPEDVADMSVTDYYKQIGKSTNRDDVRMSPSLWDKLKKKAVGESVATSSEAKPLTEDAKIIQDLSDFKPWSGAEETLDRIQREGKFDALDSLIEELYPDGIDETDLNDLLRFESDWVYEQLGMDNEEEGEDDEN